jgi:hypothetical protein
MRSSSFARRCWVRFAAVVSRAAPVLAALLAALAACNASPSHTCPYSAVVALQFTGSRAAAGALAPGLDPSPAFADCPLPGTLDPIGFPSTVAFAGTLAANEGDPRAALCRTGATNLGGSRADARWTVHVDAPGAMLGNCGATCAAISRVTVTGDVTPSAAAPTGFSGALVETLEYDAGDCGTCALPCAGRYALTGVKGAP